MCSLQQFKSLLDSTTESFIGFGDPESDILILGKECFGTKDNPWFFTVKENRTLWKDYLSNPNKPERCIDKNSACCNPSLFSPRFPFKGQLNIWDKGRQIGGTSLTWLRYQKLIDIKKGRTPLAKGEELTFQGECFITELSAIPKEKSDYSPETKQSVLGRAESFFSHDFFKDFPLVIAACESYVNRYGVDIRNLFPNSVVILCRQLSRGITSGYLVKLAEMLKHTSPNVYRADE